MQQEFDFGEGNHALLAILDLVPVIKFDFTQQEGASSMRSLACLNPSIQDILVAACAASGKVLALRNAQTASTGQSINVVYSPGWGARCDSSDIQVTHWKSLSSHEHVSNTCTSLRGAAANGYVVCALLVQ